ncbi:MAG: fluoride efflux transporter CrcB [Bacteroidales bacterium]|nr:fluoride efflux transporter CrcB [Bacteroidales bacterium]MBD5211564.1 fluoride efflux transporter CrcB [Bacteroidales bacterium]MBD5218258.1 fluoride efflux transporter CrcB [Bacteroidales bacterium]
MNIWTKILLVGLGGGIGAICRLLISTWLRVSGEWLGLTTWIINTLACFLIGLFAGWLIASAWSPWAKTAFAMLTMTGFCGGFSTFSEYTLDCIKYFEAGHVGIWVIFAAATIFSGLFCCALGYWLGSRI